MKFYLFLVAAVLISSFLFLVFGGLGLCGMNDCLGTNKPDLNDKLWGAGFIGAASIPLLTSSFLVFMHERKKPLNLLAKAIIWGEILIMGVLGAFSIIVDPGDAIWAGVPLIGYATLFAYLVLNYPHHSPAKDA